MRFRTLREAAGVAFCALAGANWLTYEARRQALEGQYRRSGDPIKAIETTREPGFVLTAPGRYCAEIAFARKHWIYR